ncbi:unnamed protein product [Cunninghamella blakesleeana]
MNTRHYFRLFTSCMDINNNNNNDNNNDNDNDSDNDSDNDNDNSSSSYYQHIINESNTLPLTLHDLEFIRIIKSRDAICFSDFMDVLNRQCPCILSIIIKDKEKYMKHLRYNVNIIQQKEDGEFTDFKTWNMLETLPFWHQDRQDDIVKRQQSNKPYRKMDIYTSLSGIKLINDAGFFTLPLLLGLRQLYIDFFHQEKSYTINRPILDAIHVACPDLSFLTLSNVDLLISDTDSEFNPLNYIRPYHDHRSGKYRLNHLNYGNQLYLPKGSTVNIYNSTDDTNWSYCTYSTIYVESINRRLKPYSSLTHLTLKNVRLLDPSKTIIYLYEKFPSIHTLELLEMDFSSDVILFNNTSNGSDDQFTHQARMNKRLELKKAIFELFTRLKHLTKFIYTLHPVIGNECAESIWPHSELSEWFKEHPNKLTSFMLPCDIYYFPSSSSLDNKIVNLHHPFYLQHLTELKIAFGPSCGEYKFINDYLNNLNSTNITNWTPTALPNLNTLSISYYERPSSNKKTASDNHDQKNKKSNNEARNIKKIKNNKKLNIFTWLNLCPQLKGLTLKGVDLVDTILKDDDSDQPLEKKDEKKTNKEQEQNRGYPLQNLTLEHVDIYMNQGIDDICTNCPKLKSIWCDYINCKWQPTPMTPYMIDYESFCETPVFIINATHLILDTLYLGHINNVFQEYQYTFTIGKAMIYELGKSTLSFISAMDYDVMFDKEQNQLNENNNNNNNNKNDHRSSEMETTISTTTAPFIEVYCQLADHVTFVGKHDHDESKDAFRSYLLKCNQQPEHIQLAKLSRKGLKACQEEKNHFAEWDYLDKNDDEDILMPSDNDDGNAYTEDIDYDDDNFFNDNDEEEDDDDDDEGLIDDDNDDDFLLC